MLGEDVKVIFFFHKSYYKVIKGCITHFHSFICVGLTQGVYLMEIN